MDITALGSSAATAAKIETESGEPGTQVTQKMVCARLRSGTDSPHTAKRHLPAAVKMHRTPLQILPMARQKH